MKKKVMSVALAVSMACTGCVSTYMGQMFYGTEVKANDYITVEYGGMKINCEYYATDEKKIDSAAVAQVDEVRKYEWNFTSMNTGEVYSTEYTDSPNVKPTSREETAHIKWVYIGEKVFTTACPGSPEESHNKKWIHLKKAYLVDVTRDSVDFSGYYNLLEDVKKAFLSSDVQNRFGEWDKEVVVDNDFSMDFQLNKGINTLNLWNFNAEQDSNTSWSNMLGQKATNICFKDDVNLKKLQFSGKDKSVSFSQHVTLQEDNTCNNFKYITFYKGSNLQNKEAGKVLANDKFATVTLHENQAGLKGAFDEVNITRQSDDYAPNSFGEKAFNEVTANSFNLNVSGVKFDKDSFYKCNITSLNSNAAQTSTFATGAINGSTIKNFNVNAETNFEKQALVSSTISNMNFNTNPKYQGTDTEGLGSDTKIENLYFNYSFTEGGKNTLNAVTSIDLPLAGITCKDIWIENPQVQLSTRTKYVGSTTEQTTIHYFGGSVIKDSTDGNKLKTLDTMVRNMTQNPDNCKYVCMDGAVACTVKLTPKKDDKGALVDNTYTVLLSDGKASVDFASKDVLDVKKTIDATSLKEQYNASTKASGAVTAMTFSADAKASTSGSNYRVYELSDATKAYDTTKVVVKYGNEWYVPVAKANVTMDKVGAYKYLIEAAGQLTPVIVEVQANTIKSIAASLKTGVTSVGIGQELAPEQIVVTATYDDGKKVELASADYVIESKKAVAGENTFTVSLKGNDKISSKVTVNGVVVESHVGKVVATYISLEPVGQYQQIPLDADHLQISYFTVEDPTVEVKVTDYSKVTLGAYTLTPDKENAIDVFYDGVKADEPIIVACKAEVAGDTNASVTEDPVETTLPEETQVPGPAASSEPVVDTSQNPVATKKPEVEKVGNKVTVKNVTYKISKITKSERTVTIIGYNKNAKTIKLVQGKVTIGEHQYKVTAVANNAFKNCKSLKGNLNFNGNILSVGKYAFYGCKNITGVVLGKKIKTIGSYAFYGCKKVKKVDVRPGDSLKKIGKKAFVAQSKGRTVFMYSDQRKLTNGTY